MAENDIYNSKQKYESFKERLSDVLLSPKERMKKYGKTNGVKHYCKNKENLQYFEKLFRIFEAKDNSYIRRLRLLRSFKLICFSTNRNLKDCGRDEINGIVANMHKFYKSPKSKSDFIKDIKFLWKNLFPEKDQMGREDETIVPYPVRHLSAKIDKSKEKLKRDKLKTGEYNRFVSFFSRNPMIQCYLTLAYGIIGKATGNAVYTYQRC